MAKNRQISQNSVALVLSGLTLATLGVFFLISLATFNAHDPSFNNATDNSPHNFFGIFGAYSSDLLLQLFGLGAYFIVVTPFIWGLQNIAHYNSYSFFIKFISYLLAVVLLLSLLANLPTKEKWSFASYGGSLGNLIYASFANLQFSYIYYIQLACFVICLYFALGFRLDFWTKIFTRVFNACTIITVKFISSIWTVMKFCKQLYSYLFKPKAANIVNNEIENSLIGIQENNITKSQPKQKTSEDKSSLVLKKNSNISFKLPGIDLLNRINLSKNKNNLSKNLLESNAQDLTKILQDFGVHGKIIGVYPGPVVTLYELQPAAGTKSSRVIGLADDIARTMCSTSARISVIPGKNSIGIELPNDTREIVYLRELIEDKSYRETHKKLPLTLGKNISGDSIIADLASMPHLLVAGTTGSGKSVAINTMVLSLLYKLSPDECKFIMIDPKMLELSVYDGIPHLLSPVVTEPKKAVTALKWVVREMENRYRMMSHLSVRNIDGYNHKIKEAINKNITLERKIQTGFDQETGKPRYENIEIEKKPLPFIVVIVDEMADLMIVAGKEIESSIQRLAQMARAAGIHLIMATQRPSVDVITGVIKANFPTRISFHVTSKVDSRTILGEMGAEQLLGKGDMLFMSGGSRIKRIHGPFVDDIEVENVAKFLKTQAAPDYSVDVTEEGENSTSNITSSGEEDELYNQAVEVVIKERKASTSYLQRYFKIGYNRAATLIEQLEKNGIVSIANHVGKREVLIGKENEN